MSETNILLESGTNEAEILEFLLHGQPFGINVHKVTSIEIFERSKLTKIPDSPREIMGAFLFRGETIPLIDTAEAVGKRTGEEGDRPLVVTVNFNDFDCGLYVSDVNRIHRINWEQFEPLDMPFGVENLSVLGSIRVEERDVLILDVESIAARLFEGLSMQGIETKKSGSDEEESEDIARRREDVPLMIVEDSALIRNHMLGILKDAGYTNIHAYENGKKAFDVIESMAAEDSDWVGGRLQVLVTDIEMPEMDGLTLCRRVKEMQGGRNLPIIMFSSLINEQMAAKCKSVGGDAWVSKPQIGQLAEMIDGFARDMRASRRAPATV